MLKVRDAVIEDIEAIVDIKIKTWLTTYRGIIADQFLDKLSESRESSIEKLKNMYSSEHRDMFNVVAEYNGKVIGFSFYGPSRDSEMNGLSNCGEVYAIYVLDEYQGLGAGKMLLKTSAKNLYNRNYSRMLIWVIEQNKSRDFYEYAGGKSIYMKQEMIGGNVYTLEGFLFKTLNSLFES